MRIYLLMSSCREVAGLLWRSPKAVDSDTTIAYSVWVSGVVLGLQALLEYEAQCSVPDDAKPQVEADLVRGIALLSAESRNVR